MSRTASANPSPAKEEAAVAPRFGERGDELLRFGVPAACLADARLRFERVTGPLPLASGASFGPLLEPSFVPRFVPRLVSRELPSFVPRFVPRFV
jgi:hypothetical protein